MAAVPRSGALLFSSSVRAKITLASKSAAVSVAAGPTLCSISGANRNPLLRSPIFSPSPSRRAPAARFCSSSPTQSPTSARASGEAVEEDAENVSPAPPVDPVKEAADALDLRVGRVLKAWRHPEADSLYVEEVDVGEAEPRTICSGLVNYVPLENLQDSSVVVLANLKPRNMRGIKSNGMLMAASDASHEIVELLRPPEGSKPGERIWFGSEEERDQQKDAASPNQVQKKKIWESVQPHLKTSNKCVAVLGDRPMRTSAGVVASTSLKNANIS